MRIFFCIVNFACTAMTSLCLAVDKMTAAVRPAAAHAAVPTTDTAVEANNVAPRMSTAVDVSAAVWTRYNTGNCYQTNEDDASQRTRS